MTESTALFMYHSVHVTMPAHFKSQNRVTAQMLWIFLFGLVTHKQMIQMSCRGKWSTHTPTPPAMEWQHLRNSWCTQENTPMMCLNAATGLILDSRPHFLCLRLLLLSLPRLQSRPTVPKQSSATCSPSDTQICMQLEETWTKKTPHSLLHEALTCTKICQLA